MATWKVVDRPVGKNIAKSGWVYKLKLTKTGEVAKYKCRLVCKGYSQEYGMDYTETFAPCVQRTTLRLIIALAAHLGLIIYEHDIETAFLNGDIDEELYMEQPEGHEVRDENDKVQMDANGKLPVRIGGRVQVPQT